MCDSSTTGCFFSSSKKQENGRSVPDLTASPGRAPPGPMPTNQASSAHQQHQQHLHRQGVKDPVLLQGDFRKVSGISSEIFRQIEAVENDHDPSTAAALEAVERRGEMIVRILEPRCIGGRQAVDAAQKLMAKSDARHTVQLVEIVKRPGQTLGLYIREGNGADRSDGVFISRIALESAVYNSGCLRVGDEILAVNLVDVTRMSLDDVVIIMSIPRRLVLAIRQRRGGRGANSPGPAPLSRPEQKPPPVVVIKRDLRDEDMDMDTERVPRSRSSRERRTGDGREMTESRSRLGLGLNNYSPQSEQLDLYYNSRPNTINEPPSWGYKPPPPPSVITEQPKGSHQFTPSHSYYQNAGTLESLAEKVHSFYPGPNRRMSTGTGGVGISQSHSRFPRSGSDQHLPRVEYSDFSSSLGRHSLLRSSLKTGTATAGGTLGRYGRYEPPSSRTPPKYGTAGSGGGGGVGAASTLTRRSRPTLDYSSDTEATIGPRPNYYYYNRPTMSSIASRGSTTALGGGPDLAKFNSLPRERPGTAAAAAARLGLRSRLGERLQDDSDGALSAPELPARRDRDPRSRISASPSIFTSDEYRAWLRRAPSSSAICEQMRASREILNQQRAHRFSCSAENIHDALKNTESIYSSRTGGGLVGTLDRHTLGGTRGLSSVPVRSLSSQHLGAASSIRSPSVRRMRQLLELSAGPASPSSLGGHQSPAPTPSTTLPRTHRQIDINPAEFAKYKLDKPVLDIGGISGMLWIHLLAGRGLRTMPEGATPQQQQQASSIRDLYCVLECDRVHKARTVVRSGDLQFDWDESFELDLVCNKQLDVLVYSWDPQHRHKLCYRGAISLATLLRQSPLHQLALKVEPRGTIYLRLRHTDPGTLYRRRGLPSLRAGYPQLFGVDLETVVTREAKGAPGSAPVPIVLRRCVEEVERRGLDIIGLYRLCGSATKKRLLREAFERNSRAVELSPEHVPDINVITGVLKDYLRELPEPLFTRCLFQMTVDALAVCLPDDPEGNAKLMLSILDCLPRANRATLVFLLDHLSLVVSASERNKMSAQALATVMGPPLMLHSSNTGINASTGGIMSGAQTTPSSAGDDIDHAQPIAVLKYLLQIWPQPQQSSASGRRGEPAGQRGNKASALQVGRQVVGHQQHHQGAPTLHITTHSAASSPSIGRHQLSVTPNSHPSQSVVGQLVQSPRASQQVGQQPHQSVGLADSVGRVQSQPPATPSPGSSSSSSGSGSGSGTDTVKRGASPSVSITSVVTARFKDSGSSFSINKQHQQESATSSYKHGDVNDIKNGSGGGSSSSSSYSNNNSTNNYGPNSSDLLPSRSVLFSNDCTTSGVTSSSGISSISNYSIIKDHQLNKSSTTSNLIIGQTTGLLSAGSGSGGSSSGTSPNDQTLGTPSSSASPIHNQRGANNMQSSTSMLLTTSDQQPSSYLSLRNQTISSPLGSYQFPSSNINLKSSSSTSSSSSIIVSSAAISVAAAASTLYSSALDDNLPTVTTTSSSSSTLPLRKTSSPSRQISYINTNTNTLPSTVAKTNNNLYQSESSYSLTNNKNQQLSHTSPGSITNTMNQAASASPSSHYYYQQTQQQQYNNTMNIYGTLPKSSLPYTSQYTGVGYTPSSVTSGGGSGSGNGPNSDLLFSSSTSFSSGIGNAGLGSSSPYGTYRVQYASTNPFLPTYNPPPGEQQSVSPVPSINLTKEKIDEE